MEWENCTEYRLPQNLTLVLKIGDYKVCIEKILISLNEQANKIFLKNQPRFKQSTNQKFDQ